MAINPVLELRENNPYSIGSLFLFPEGDYALDPGNLNYQKSIGDRYFTTEQADAIWTIADQAYGDSKQWWKIAMANKIFNPFELEPGTTLLIPDLDQLKLSTLDNVG